MGRRLGDKLILGELVLPADGSRTVLDGPVTIFYRPEALVLTTDRDEGTPSLGHEVAVSHILPTAPLVRVMLEGAPGIAALLLARDVARLGLEVGAHVTVGFPPGSLCAFRHPETATALI